MRKIIQITASGGDENPSLYALCDDGTVWDYIWAGTRFAHPLGVPLPDGVDANTRIPIPAHWIPLTAIPAIPEGSSS